ncbi:hypothetical protein DL93DRAFT_924290 [Clavulina sp. PMI_390]|nr:hypothetical protein DL93DRAFT_924290 [Clavulina sp. PMI_390]
MPGPLSQTSSSNEESYLFGADDSQFKDLEDIPSYQEAIRPQITKHIFSSRPLAKGSSISLELNSAAANPDSTPLFSEGAIIEGRVLLDFKKNLNVKEVQLTVRGQATSMIGSIYPVSFNLSFLEITRVLWPSSHHYNTTLGQPSSSSSRTSTSSNPPHWLTFRLGLPPTLSYEGKQYTLPPTYTGKAYIDYSLEVTIKRDFLHSDFSLQAPFRYIPQARPEANHRLSLTRALPSPGFNDAIDPVDWHVSNLTIAGRSSNASSDGALVARVLIPQPVEYRTGSIVAFRIFLSTTSSQIAPSVLAPENWEVSLVQHCTLRSPSVKNGTSGKLEANNEPGPDSSFADILAKAKLTSPTTAPSSTVEPDGESTPGHARILDGKIRMPRDLVANFEFPFLNIEYSIRLTPKIPDFEQLDPQPVEVPITVVACLPGGH